LRPHFDPLSTPAPRPHAFPSRSFNFFPTDLLWLSPDYSRPRGDYYSDEPQMSFPEAIFSFVFGDGDPNKQYDEQRWRALGQYIQARWGGGVWVWNGWEARKGGTQPQRGKDHASSQALSTLSLSPSYALAYGGP
jgi:hypothetical protein